MAYANPSGGITITLEAGADLSSLQYNLVKLDANGRAVVCDADSAGQVPIGVLQNKPDASGKAATILVVGVTKIEAGVAFNEGDRIAASDGSSTADDGQAVVADASDCVVGQMIVACSADEISTAVINCASPTLF